jgi:hypothetical protein
MKLFEMMAGEHQRVAAGLMQCIEAPQSSSLTGADTKAVRTLGQYLDAQQRSFYPALIALQPDDADEPVLRHQRMTVHVLATLTHCRRGGRDGQAAVRMLHRAWSAHAEYEQGQLRCLFEAIFTADELRQLAGALRLEMSAPDDSDSSGGLRHAVMAWRWLLQRMPTVRRRCLPALREAVFVYRAS